MNRQILCICALVLIVGMNCACSRQNAVSIPSEQHVEEPRTDVIIRSSVEPESLDIQQTPSTRCAIFARNIHANLVRANSDGSIYNELADNWRVDNDFSEYTVTLKDNLKFSDGSPLTADDVKYSFDRGIEKGLPYYQNIKSIEAKDSWTIVFHLKTTNTQFLHELCMEYYSVMSRKALESGMNPAELPNITSGAYYVERWEKGKALHLRANPYYFAGEASIKKILSTYNLDSKESYEELTQGAIDFVTHINGDNVALYKAHEHIDVMDFDSIIWYFLCLNHNVPYFADRNVRLAMHYGIDRDRIISEVLDGNATPADLPVCYGIGGYLSGYSVQKVNLVKACEYMKKSAFPDGFTFTMLCSNKTRVDVAKSMQTQLAPLGIYINIEEASQNEVNRRIRTDDAYEAALWSYSMSSGDISYATALFYPGSGMNFCNAKDGIIGNLLKQSIRFSGTEREQHLRKIYDMMEEEMPYIGLYWPTIYYAKNSKLMFKAAPSSEKYNIYDMYWRK